MRTHDFLIILLAFVSEFIGTISGFGSSTFFVPAALLFEKIFLILAISSLLHCFSNLFKLILFRKSFEWKNFLVLAIPFTLFSSIGALIVTQSAQMLVRPLLGIVLIFSGTYSLLFKNPKRGTPLPIWVAILLSCVSGFSTGFLGTGGAIRGLALTVLQVSKNSFVALSSAIDLGGDLIRAIIYLHKGFMDWHEWFYIPAFLLASYLGAYLGKQILQKVNQLVFERIVAIFVILSGITMVYPR